MLTVRERERARERECGGGLCLRGSVQYGTCSTKDAQDPQVTKPAHGEWVHFICEEEFYFWFISLNGPPFIVGPFHVTYPKWRVFSFCLL